MSINPEALTSLFPIFFTGVLVFNIVLFFILAHRAEKKFKGLLDNKILFREKGASGHSTKSFITKMGGASKALDVIITDVDLAIKGIYSPFTVIGTFYDLTHRIPRNNISSVELISEKVHLNFSSTKGKHTVVLSLKDTNLFMKILGNEKNT